MYMYSAAHTCAAPQVSFNTPLQRKAKSHTCQISREEVRKVTLSRRCIPQAIQFIAVCNRCTHRSADSWTFPCPYLPLRWPATSLQDELSYNGI